MVKSPASNTMERVDESKYRGVRKRKGGKWVSEIRVPNSREKIWLGSYDSPEKAARAFDAALFCLRGNTANFNFPHQPPNIPGATDLPTSQIQAVAATYANESSSPPSDLHPSQIQAVAATYANESSLPPSLDEDESLNNNNYHLQIPASTDSNNVDVVPSFNSFLMELDDRNINHDGVPDYGNFPGFDDYGGSEDQ